MDILSIGNSFSEDAHRYLHGIARADGIEMNTYNLYIGGCSLERHYRNMLSERRVYELQMNGENTGFYVSLKEALLNRKWDIVTLQQVSCEATDYETYQPYLNKIAEYIRMCQPGAKIAFHETWAYEKGSQRLCEKMGYRLPEDMFGDVEKSVKKAAEDIDAEFIIPSGKIIQKLTEAGIQAHRDTFHASMGAGRYALGLLWYAMLSGNDVCNCTFADFDENVSQNDIEFIKKCIMEVIQAI